MEKLQNYLDTQYKQDKERLEETLTLIRNCLPLFYETFSPKYGWPYSVEKEINPQRQLASTFSYGTLAMTSGALKALLETDLPKKDIYKLWTLKEPTDGKAEQSTEKLTEIAVGKAVDLLLHTINDASTIGTILTQEDIDCERFDLTQKTILSDTYGVNSVFVLSWIYDLLEQEAGNNTKENECDGTSSSISTFNQAQGIPTPYLNIQGRTQARDELKKLVVTRLKSTLTRISDPGQMRFYETNTKDETKNPTIDVRHAFPLLKAIHLYERLLFLKDNDAVQLISEGTTDFLERLEEHLLNKLHYFISLAEIENSRFDAAELVFSLEGLLSVRKLRLDPNDDSENASIFLCEKGLLERVFSILEKKQEINSYWRPLSPFITTQKGLALLPISVEITQSLLRICEILGENGKQLFFRSCGIFNRYFDWVKSKVITVKCGEKRVYGWSSEHIFSPATIHIWQSSQILIFLTKYYSFLRDKIASDALAAANLSVTKPGKAIPGFWTNKPFGSDLVHAKIQQKVIESKEENSSVSFLLYGPPGTGKTTFAEQIAVLKQWPLLSLSPSDFIADGVDKLETKAKNLFKVLCAQHNLVILFDEIDRLLLNRNSEAYQDQGDMFQLMVASLLVKFKQLRDTPHIIFMIATNYGYRLDPAIVRPGRVDYQILVTLPDKEQRTEIVCQFVAKLQGKKLCEKDERTDQLKVLASEIAKRTPLFAFGEMQQLMNLLKASIDLKKTDYCEANNALKGVTIEILDNCIGSIIPMVSLSQYTNRIMKKKDAQDGKEPRPVEDLPVDEILMIAYTIYECNEKDKRLLKEKANGDLYRLVENNQEYIQDKVTVALGKTVWEKVEGMLQTIESEENTQGGNGDVT